MAFMRVSGGVAQLGEHLLCKQGVIGSNPFTSIQCRFAVLSDRFGGRDECETVVSVRPGYGGEDLMREPRDTMVVRSSLCCSLGVRKRAG